MSFREAAEKTLHEILDQGSRNGMRGTDTIALGQALATMALVEAVTSAAEDIVIAIDRSHSA